VREKNKKKRGGKNFSWVEEKNTLLQALVRGLACSGLQECIFFVRGLSFFSPKSKYFLQVLTFFL
jgi:hypothetical protein